jgi:Asp-tRNA(Asn)/Glu-tRNA(Gln) amidotransferase A subunit family amidase
MPLPTPKLQPYTLHLADFAAGRDTPTAFLERCLANVEAFEPTVGAFVHIEIEKARAAAAASTARWRSQFQRCRVNG